MSDYLFLPLQGEIIRGICVDPEGTNIREDLIRVEVKNNKVQIDIACLVPPVRNISLEELHASLELQRTNVQYHPKQRFFPFISLPHRRHLSFNESSPRTALIATYVLNEYGKRSVEELSVSEATATLWSYDEFHRSSESQMVVWALKRLMYTYDELSEYINNGLKMYPRSNGNLGFQTSFISTALFNHTCREAVKKEGIPFIAPLPLQKSFFLNDGSPKFNCCLRDPHAYINASNLMAYFSEKELFFTEEYLKKTLSLIAIE